MIILFDAQEILNSERRKHLEVTTINGNKYQIVFTAT